MSSPIPALSPARSHDHPTAVAALVPLSRRAQQDTDPLAGASAERRARQPEGTGTPHDLRDDLPTPDGNPFAVVGRVDAAPQLVRHGKGLPLDAATRVADAAAGAGGLASGRHDLSVRLPAMPAPDVSRVDDSAGAGQERPVRPSAMPPAARADSHRLAGKRTAEASRSPSRDVLLVEDTAGPADVLPLRSPASPPAIKDVLPALVDGRLPASGTAPATPTPSTPPPSDAPFIADRADRAAAATSLQPEKPRTAPEQPMPLLHAAGPATAQVHTGPVRRQGNGPAAAQPDPARAELPAAAPAQRMATVSVPFSSWGPGHQVTASWIPAAVPGQLPPMTLRSSSESAQRAIGSALAASDPLAPGSLQLTAADSADDGTSGRRQADYVPEDEE
ncbi:hypothetical protein ABE522_09060 [Stenotrophomonas pennii]|uniref:hypothetical protein n=1 Tax=Stenotrophomonas lacuserhaii TaxID=2760084 RepID=UPI00320A7193